ncbi:MAG: hypothetical protein K0R82_1886 [Flavipsychrobacter sp.]|jgi:hypothetical protein|nr:hypothetical protein [Flavipsychrobacter sp.]
MKRPTALMRTLIATTLSVAARLAYATADISAGWARLTDDPAFHYKNSREAQQKLPQPQENLLNKIGSILIDFFTSPIGKFIGWVIFFALIAWTLFKVFFNNDGWLFARKAKSIDKPALENVEEDNMIDTDWEHQLDRAMQESDARLAIRFSFMRSLQLLQLNGLIHFQDNKTNADYYRELGKAELKNDFKQLSKQYEHTWYGQLDVSDDAYRTYMTTFNDLKNRLRQS